MEIFTIKIKINIPEGAADNVDEISDNVCLSLYLSAKVQLLPPSTCAVIVSRKLAPPISDLIQSGNVDDVW